MISNENSKKVVNALSQMLMTTPLDTHLQFMQSIGVQYSLSGNVRSRHREDKFIARIFIVKDIGISNKEPRVIREYKGTSVESMKQAFCRCFTQFIISEECDYHLYYDHIPGQKKKKKIRASNHKRAK